MPMRPYLIMLACTLPVAACVPGPPPPASQYHMAASTTQLPLVFAPGTTDLTEPGKSALRQLRQTLPIRIVPVLQTAGPRAAERARRGEALLVRVDAGETPRALAAELTATTGSPVTWQAVTALLEAARKARARA